MAARPLGRCFLQKGCAQRLVREPRAPEQRRRPLPTDSAILNGRPNAEGGRQWGLKGRGRGRGVVGGLGG